MKSKAGLWIDHHAAVIVELSDTGDQIRHVKSHVEKQLRRSGEPSMGSFPAQEVPADDSREREYQGDLARYYDEVISHLGAAEEILIFGPGEAKKELRKRFASNMHDTQVISVEAADKMTEPQIVAHVRQHFHHLAARRGIKFQKYQTLNPG
jgi:hypothetical protein